jgi:hypothetical protein
VLTHCLSGELLGAPQTLRRTAAKFGPQRICAAAGAS